mgnify:CR=1 FL=1
MKPATKLKAIDDLLKSKGWSIVLEIMHEEIVQSAMAIAESQKMELDEINFRRGSIWAAKQFLEMPVRLRQKVEADVALKMDDDTPPLG